MTCNFWPMTRGERFERALSRLHAAIGDVEALRDIPGLCYDHLDRVRLATARLDRAYKELGK